MIREYILAFISDQGLQAKRGGNDDLTTEDRKLDNPLRGIASSLDMTYEQLYDAIVRKDGAETMDFNLADRLLCKIGRWDEWLLNEELNEVYVQVNLSQHSCGRVGCTKIIPESIRYCSNYCTDNPESTSQTVSDFKVAA